MAEPRKAEPAWQRHGIVLGCPRRCGVPRVLTIGWDRSTHPQPLGSRFAPGSEVQARVIREDLETRSDDEHHEQQVEEVLPAQPPREPVGHVRHVVRRRSRVPLDERTHPVVLADLAGNGDRKDQADRGDRDQPQRGPPPPTDPQRRHLCSFLGDAAGPVADDDPTVEHPLALVAVESVLERAGLVRWQCGGVSHVGPIGRRRCARAESRPAVWRAAPIRRAGSRASSSEHSWFSGSSGDRRRSLPSTLCPGGGLGHRMWCAARLR